MTFDPIAATGLVLDGDGQSGVFRGTCFVFRQPTHVLTAAHIVSGLDPKRLTVILPRTLPLESHRVSRVELCPDVDLALIEFASSITAAEPFWDFVSNFSLGEELMAYGFPEDVMGPNRGQATPRLFRGYYQRYFHHRSHMGFGYNAGEMSIGAPGGLSGGPVFRPGALCMLTGLVTENFESTTQLEAVEEEHRDTGTITTRFQRVIQYGVSLLLDTHAAWLDRFLMPHRHQTA